MKTIECEICHDTSADPLEWIWFKDLTSGTASPLIGNRGVGLALNKLLGKRKSLKITITTTSSAKKGTKDAKCK